VDLTPSDEQRSIISSVAEFLAEKMPTSRVRELRDVDLATLSGFWKQGAAQGWFGLGLAEEHGGAGYGLVDEALLFRELGRFLTPGPVLATALAARVAALGGQAELAAAIVAGEAPVGLALPRPGAQVEIGTKVIGTFDLIDAAHTSYVLAVGAAGASLLATSDCTDRQLALPIDDVGSREIGSFDCEAVVHVPTEVEDVAQRGVVLTTALLVGICEATRDMATAYAKTREQFGKPIGSFQSIKHRCADMAVGADAAGALLLFAALCVAEERSDAGFQLASARIVAERQALWSSRENIQVHGGMGFTAECDAHLYLKRTHLLGMAFGGLRGAQADLLAQPAAQ
jgi:alkylation response protein AidB-like acyl-CoA dehydrogenase